mmetsp:Transcript_9943/g.13309  ORF Transcript_9943/g.13309 Transcript_9943/m.13309 type:complete len:91 (-) Transcript_9943:59-331(-)
MSALFPILSRSRVSFRCMQSAPVGKRHIATVGVKIKSTFFERLSSFVVGAGVTAIATQYFIYSELHEANKSMLHKQASLEKRLAALEKKK